MKAIITCHTIDELVTICIELLKKGICFEANTGDLSISLTGGF